MKKRVALFAVVCGVGASLMAQGISPELEKEVRASVDKGLAWLKAQQKPSGAWSDEGAPALTALPLWAIVSSGSGEIAAEVDKAVAFLLGKQQPDGGIYVPVPGRPGGGLGNYNTAVCLTALHATGRRDITQTLLKARDYVASSQLTGDDQYAGGFGYDKASGRRYADLNNAVFSIDAMRRTQGVEDLRPAGEKRADLDWDAALKYVSGMQVKEGETAGGFAYNLNEPKGGADAAAEAGGRPMLRAYGSISYAGLLGLVHSRLEKSDPRVRSAIEYGSRFWTLEENPGQGQQGLYFYYNVMARALGAAGIDALPTHEAEGSIKWREDVARKVISLQKSDGSWMNDNNRWWENDPVLATSYSLLALEFAAGITR